MQPRRFTPLFAAAFGLVVGLATTASAQLAPLAEAQSIVALGAAEAGRTVADFNGSDRGFPEDYHAFLPSAISLDDLADPTRANATLPLYEGVGPDGEPTYFIITEATSIELARAYGAILSPKLRYGSRPEAADAAQRVEVVDGRIVFRGGVDFSPVRSVTPGTPFAFPPAAVQPGAVGDAEYSSLVVLPSGEVINAQVVANASGVHDRIVDYDLEQRWATFQLLDGWEGGDRFYYHLVTDASDPGPAAIELGVYAPRLANLPTFGNSALEEETVLLGFSPVANGLTISGDDAGELDRQSLSSTIADGDLDPVNVFPFDPTNDVAEGNNYSPLWDAHINMWTDEAINGAAGDQRRAITSFDDLESLVDEGLVTSFEGSPGQANDFVFGLRATNAVINCPVICHPFQGEGRVARTPAAEARSIVELGAREANREVSDFNGSARTFDREFGVFLPSAISLDSLTDPAQANVTLPLYEGVRPNGEPVYFIITEATSPELAAEYGAILSPKLRYGSRAEAQASAQRIDVVDGRVYFKGDVDFAPERVVTPGSPFAFPPASVQPGAVGDSAYSSLAVLPTGEVINAQVVANATGVHDRIVEINTEERWAKFQLLDGWEGGERFYYHLVTDASDIGAATIELGVYAPRLANLPAFGNSALEEGTVLLGFSPVANGLTLADGANERNRQSLSSTILDNDLDPVNVFPFDPTNDVVDGNNYSPLWDAHINMWTDEAINGPAGDQRRAITSFAELFGLIDSGLVESFMGNTGPENAFVGGLRASNAVINCPVIAHPFQARLTDDTSVALVTGRVQTTDGEEAVYICPGPGNSEPIDVELAYEVTTGRVGYPVTDSAFNLIAVSPNPSVDVSGAGSGTCYIFAVNYTGELTIEAGQNVFGTPISDGEFLLSDNGVRAVRQAPAAGTVLSQSGESTFYTCIDGESDFVGFTNSGASRANYVYVITGADDVVLAVNERGFQDFDGAGVGACRVYGLSYTGDLSVAPGDLVTDSQLATSCFDLTDNWLTVVRADVEGGEVALADGTERVMLTAGAGAVLDLTTTSASEAAYGYFALDASGGGSEIVALTLDGRLDLSAAAPGYYLIYGVSHSGEVLLGAGDAFFGNRPAAGCFEQSGNAVVVNLSAGAEPFTVTVAPMGGQEVMLHVDTREASDAATSVRVVDAFGRTILLESNLHNSDVGTRQLQLTGAKAGVHFVSVERAGGVVTKRVVLE